MKRKLRKVLLICGIALGLSFLVYPFLSGKAQKGQDQEQKRKDQESALRVIRQNVIANNFYKTLQEKESGWTLAKAFYYPGGLSSVGGQDGENSFLTLQKDKAEIQASITEYKSEEDAKSPLKMHISQGVIKDCKGKECGDEGQRIYSPNGDFAYLRFRKGYFYVSMHCNSEEIANRFALHVINAITNK